MKSPLRAIYYPHNRLSEEAFLKYALVFWDNVEVICPKDVRGDERPYDIRRAAELIEVKREPTEDAASRVERRVSELLANGVPAWMTKPLPAEVGFPYRVKYPIYLSKFTHETWGLLKDNGLAQFNGAQDNEPATNPAVGLLLMGLLAEEMAGKTRHRITDREGPYQWLAKLLAMENGAEPTSRADIAASPANYKVLTSVDIPVLTLDEIPLSRLTQLREREIVDPGLRDIRINYSGRVAALVDAIQQPDLTPADVDNLLSDYADECTIHMRELNALLGRARRDLVLSDKVWVGIYMGAAAALGFITSAVTAPLALISGAEKIAGIRKAGEQYSDAQLAAMRTRPISWRYLASK